MSSFTVVYDLYFDRSSQGFVIKGINHTGQIFLIRPSVSSCVRHGCNPLERFSSEWGHLSEQGSVTRGLTILHKSLIKSLRYTSNSNDIKRKANVLFAYIHILCRCTCIKESLAKTKRSISSSTIDDLTLLLVSDSL